MLENFKKELEKKIQDKSKYFEILDDELNIKNDPTVEVLKELVAEIKAMTTNKIEWYSDAALVLRTIKYYINFKLHIIENVIKVLEMLKKTGGG